MGAFSIPINNSVPLYKMKPTSDVSEAGFVYFREEEYVNGNEEEPGIV